ncbi:hypothetical protein K432DRAFT_430225 [Lepidopterella palustris CBS 459.81]|uniref:Uncharacterized protein n=1 Tax=Lepidopterella palustris CBS 459.81 TaxID=1314670 RepID=A0A8E2J9B1_9PEZI|nr:hypothetical protein K432DRAFT_430225 [Lepidopterella palustris CBS 459.81]
MSSLAVQVCINKETWSLDFSKDESLEFVLQLLRDQGIVVLKGVTEAAPKLPQAQDNKFINALVGSARDGDFYVSFTKEYDFAAYAALQYGRSPDWERLAKERDIVAIACYHLGGDPNQRWVVTYDSARRENPTDRMLYIEAFGGDIVICNGWLRRSSPSPTDKGGKVVVVHYMWKKFKPT